MEGNIFDWLYQNRESVLRAYAETGGSPQQVWKLFPELEGLTKFNSFKTYLKPIVEMLNRVERESGQELNKVKQNVELQTERLNTVKQTETGIPGNVEGWTIALTGGYYKAFKKVAGKVRGVHLGKVFALDRAVEKIRSKEIELGIGKG